MSTPNEGNFTRSAAGIHALALLAFAALIALATLLGLNGESTVPIIAVGGASCAVLALWSALLTYRAFSCREKSRWIPALFFLLMTEFGVLASLLWTQALNPSPYRIVNSAVWLGLPVFGPFLALSSMLAVPLAIRRARTVNAREEAAAVPERKRTAFKSGVKTYALIVAALGVVLLPAPLFLLGAVAPPFFDSETQEPVGWGGAIADATPNVVRDTVESVLEHAAAKSEFCSLCNERILRGGRVSKTKLIERLHQSRRARTLAWDALTKFYPDAAIENADLIARTGKQVFVREVPQWFARHATATQILYVLDPDNEQINPAFRAGFLDELDPERVPEAAIPLLEKLIANAYLHNSAYRVLLWRASPDDVARLWRSYLRFPTLSRRAARYMVACIQRDLPGVVLDYLKDSHLATRGTAVLQLAVYRDGLRPHVFRNPMNLEYRKLVRQLHQMLDDPDNVIKLSAMCVLSDIFREGEAPEVLASATSKIEMYYTPSRLITLDPAELAEIEAVRAAVKKFLDPAEPPNSTSNNQPR